ncbi:MAG TPA: CDGSH iron-sulfur domain-containing protein [Dehalococcoidia bacterium]|jgi:CDGSH-type Zn-finger protein
MADETRIVVRPNGPYLIEGPLTVVDVEGNEYKSDRPRIALCRCGGSSNKPFCDGTHQRNGFQAPSAAPGA